MERLLKALGVFAFQCQTRWVATVPVARGLYFDVFGREIRFGPLGGAVGSRYRFVSC